MERMSEGFQVESWRGIRRDESQNRKDAIDRERMAEGYDIVHPIVAWTAQQVVDFVISRGLRLNGLYSQGMSRVGCMPCINCNKDELAEIGKRFPEHIDKIREWERLVCLAAKRGWTTFFADAAMTSPRPIPGWIRTIEVDEKTGIPVVFWLEPDHLIHARLNIDARVEWAMTSHGGRQQDFIRQAPATPCASLYGLCE
jgi:3'-phosphoadenosine 5'-phosphosulfate sulfotransferase (PAPS reductase)/FAD synthetase